MSNTSSRQAKVAVLAALQEHGGVVREEGKAQITLYRYVQEFKIMGRSTVSAVIVELEKLGTIYRKSDSPITINEVGILDLGEYTDDVAELIKNKDKIELRSIKRRVSPKTSIVHNPVSNDGELQMRVISQMHRIHELEKVITNMEPYLRQFDVFEYVAKGVVHGSTQ